MLRGRSSGAILAVIAALLTPAPVLAQAFRVGPTFSIGGTTAPVINPDVAYNPRENQYLAVAGKLFIEARVLSATGAVLHAFRVNESINYAQQPRVAYSPDIAGGAGGYLVTWHESIGNFARVRGRIFKADNSPATGDFDIATNADSPATGSNWLMGAAIAYSTVSKEFLVTWQGHAGWTRDVFFQRVNNAGALLGPTTPVTATATHSEREPGVAYNPDTNQYYIGYAGYDDHGSFGYAAGRRVQAGTGAFVGGVQTFGAALATYMATVVYNPAHKQWLFAWYNLSRGAAQVFGVALNGADAAQIGDIRILSAYYAAYDALDIDYNPPSGQFLLVTHSQIHEDAAVSIKSDMTAYDNGFLATNTADFRAVLAGDGNFNPMMAASTAEKKWLIVTSSKFVQSAAQFLGSSASGGGPATGDTTSPPPPGPTPPPPPPPPGPAISALNPSHVLPSQAGTSITWTAVASGGTTALLYQFERWRPGTGWQIVRPYATSASAVILALGGNQAVRVSVKQTSSSAAADAQSNAVFFVPRPNRSLSLNPVGGGDVFAYHGGNGGGYVLSGDLGVLTQANYGTGWGAGNAVVTADFNGDGLADVLTYNAATGYALRGINNGSNNFDFDDYGWAAGLTVVAGDFNGDGRDDLFTYSKSTGAWTKQLTDAAWVFQQTSGTWSLNWEVTPGDFNADGITDIFVYNKTPFTADTGRYVRALNGPNGSFTAYVEGSLRWWTGWTVMPGDFDGDSRTDLLLYGTDGRWYKVFFPTSTGPERYTNGLWSTGWVPRVGDFDGDRKDDVFVYNQTSGDWYVCISTGDNWGYHTAMRWAGGFVPTATDINRDGLADLIVYNPSDGRWFQIISSAIPAQFGYYTGDPMETGLQMIASLSIR